jgi:hypothetical protein
MKHLHLGLVLVISLLSSAEAQRHSTFPANLLPVTSWQQEAKITESQATILGYCTAMSGNTVAVGAVAAGKGVVYVFTGSGSNWSLVASLTSSNELTDDAFGTAVAISGDTIAVGAYGVNGEQGAAYVFVKPAGGWKDMHETAMLTSSDGLPNENFGFAVAINGDTVVAGSIHNNTEAGAAYVFVKPASGWKKNMTQTAELTPSDYGGWMGYSLAISGDTVVAGAPITGPYTEGGAAYIYVKPTNGWASMTQTAKLTASDESTDLLLGLAVGMSGDTVAATGPGDALYKGAVYLAVKPKNGWKKNMTETAKLTTRDGLRGYYFGASVVMNGDTLLAGARWIQQQTGAAYVFVKPKRGWHTTWNYKAKLTASDGQAGDEFGFSVALYGKTAIVGALYNDSKQGATYVFGQ